MGGLPLELYEWIQDRDTYGLRKRNLSKTQVVLGPHNESFWAGDGDSYTWAGLPSKLESMLLSLRDRSGGWFAKPKIVALGADRDFVLTTDSTAFWNLPHYQKLDAELRWRDIGGKLGAVKVRQPSLFCFLLFYCSGWGLFADAPSAENSLAPISL